MTKFGGKYRIESNRWQFWDYSAPGSYFITICIQHRKHILGTIKNGTMQLSDYGSIVKNEFEILKSYNCRIAENIWVVMPNHVHCLITLGDYDFDNGVGTGGGIIGRDGDDGDDGRDGDNVEKIHEFSLPPQPRKQRRQMVISKLMGKFQMQTSKQINRMRNTPGVKNWQANYHDHVVRNNDEYERIKYYIINNPKKWDDDKFNKPE